MENILIIYQFKNTTKNGISKYTINAFNVRSDYNVIEYNYILMNNGLKCNKNGIFIVSMDDIDVLKNKLESDKNIKLQLLRI